MKYLAFRLPDLAPIGNDVPLGGVSLGRGVNEAGVLEATLDRARAYERVLVEGTTETVELIRERGTLLIAWDGRTARAFIVETVEPDSESQERLRIQAFGHGSVLDGQRWSDRAMSFIEEDPLNIVRHLWAHSSSFDDMLTVTVDDTRSPVRVGEEEREVEFETSDGTSVSFDAGPRRLNWWTTTDMGKVFADYAEETPFEWAEETRIDMDSDDPPTFHIRLGYPRLGAPDRSETHHFEVGLNVIDPDHSDDEEHQFFSEVFVVGNGEGSQKIRGEATRRNTGRLRTVRVIEDQGITSTELAKERARKAVEAAEQDDKFWEQITVLPHPAAQPGTYDVGDIITVKGDTAWGWHEQRCRIVELSHTVADDTITLTLERWQGGS